MAGLMALNPGSKLGPYEIVSLLGSGGMGEVYAARDTRLNRIVAIKVLPIHLSGKPGVQDRFDREARAIASLNHPNICQVHDVGSQDGISYLVMERLEGEPLADRLQRGRLPLDQVLRFGMEVADALDAAHDRGIIHRDLKPGNIFVTAHGECKVLDFGLAKLEEDAEESGGALTSPAVLTSPGTALGTVAYMSPEQARGDVLDSRTDIFSLGAVLYEMATGRSAFTGKTSALVFKAILDETPSRPLQIDPALPPKLDDVIVKAIEKDRELRYQVAAEMRSDLKRLQRDLSLRGAGSSGGDVSQLVGATADESGPASTPQSQPSGASSVSSSSTKVIVDVARHHKQATVVALVIALLVIVAAGFGVRSLLTRRPQRLFGNYTVTKIAETTGARFVAISPDGKYLALVRRDEKGEESLWLRHLPTNSNAQVVTAVTGAIYGNIVFSSDGNYIYFRRGGSGAKDTKTYDLYRVAVLGGTPSLVARDIDSNPTFSPDGQQMTFIRDNDPEMGKYRLLIANSDGGTERTLVSGDHPTPFEPAWSPDGKTIVCVGDAEDKSTTVLVAIDVETGKQRVFARLKIFREFLANLTWLHDGSGLLVIHNKIQSGRLGFVSYPQGEFKTIATDSGQYEDISLTSNDQTLAAVVANENYHLYLLPASGAVSEAKQLTALAGGSDGSWTRDGKLLIDPDGSIVQLDPETGDRTTILADEKLPSFIPVICPDDRTIVFISIVPNTPSVNIWKIDRSGQGMQQLTFGNEDIFPVCSADNKWVYYRDGRAQAIMRVPLAGGSPTKIGSSFFSQIGQSPDGKLLAFLNGPESKKGDKYHLQIVLLSTDGSVPPRAIDADPRFALEDRPWAGMLRFMPDGKAYAYAVFENSVGNIWVQPLDGSPPKALTNFTSEEIRDFNWSADGKHLAIVRGHTDSGVVLLRAAGQD